MKNKVKTSQNECGITLIALIITIIILIILAVVSLNVMFGDRIIEIATNGVGNYVSEQIKEQEEFNRVDSHIESTINNVNKEDKALVLGTIKTNRDIDAVKGSWIEIETSATDKQESKLDYTLKVWKKENEEVDESELIKGEATKKITKENIDPGTAVTLKIEGLEEYTEYLYKVEVSNKVDTAEGQVSKIRTYCSGTGLRCPRYSMSFL